MKKKTIVWAYLLVLSLGTILSLYIPKNEVAAKDAIVIPGQAIRLRILANSDLDKDQALKRKVRDAVNAKIAVWVQDLTSISEARKVIKSKLPDIEATAEAVVKQEGSQQSVNVKFGKVQFPTKLYGQFLYPAGDYEAILITLGEGQGANWWCVLYPPLCFLDFSNGVAVSNGFEEKKAAPVEKGKTEKSAKTAKAEDEAPAELDIKDESAVPNKDTNDKSAAAESSTETNDESAVAAKAKTDDSSVTELEPKGKSSAKSLASVPNRVQKQVQTEEVVQAAALGTIEETSPSTHEDTKKVKQAPVYTSEDEQPIKVKFFIVELWNKIF